MYTQTIEQHLSRPASGWMKRYYFIRFAVSTIWVAVALSGAKNVPWVAAAMLIAYPAWDAIANLVDAQQNGGFARNKTQLLNFVVSTITAIAVGLVIGDSIYGVLIIFGIWAGLAGILQLATAVRRWKSYGAQWAMILSGAQSALAGLLFVKMAGGSEPVGIFTVVPYAAFGAFYFFIGAVWLTVSDIRKRASHSLG